MEQRKCSKCGLVKDRDEFNKTWSYCKKCSSEYSKIEKQRRKNLGICTKCGENKTVEGYYCEECKQKNRNKVQERKSAGLCVECGKHKPAKNRSQCEKCLERSQRRRDSFVAKGICSQCRKNPIVPGQKSCQECSSKARSLHQGLKKEVMQHYGGTCVCCGESRLEFLCIDHKNGDGKKHREKFKHNGCGAEIYRWLKKNSYPEGFQVLCFNCNHADGIFGFCPHKSLQNHKNSLCEDIQVSSDETKICSVCRKQKCVSEFHWEKPRRGHSGVYYARCKQCHNDLVRKRARELKIECLNHYGSAICQCCGETHLEFLTLDHIDGDGTQHRKEISKDGRGAHIYRWLKKNNFPSGFRVLCMNCNFVIGHFGYCPHQSDSKE